jgi:hypothetical protein
MQEFSPPNQVLATRRQPDILRAEPALRDQQGIRSGASEECFFRSNMRVPGQYQSFWCIHVESFATPSLNNKLGPWSGHRLRCVDVSRAWPQFGHFSSRMSWIPARFRQVAHIPMHCLEKNSLYMSGFERKAPSSSYHCHRRLLDRRRRNHNHCLPALAKPTALTSSSPGPHIVVVIVAPAIPLPSMQSRVLTAPIVWWLQSICPHILLHSNSINTSQCQCQWWKKGKRKCTYKDSYLRGDRRSHLCWLVANCKYLCSQ